MKDTSISQNIDNTETDNHSENWRSNEDNYTAHEKDVTDLVPLRLEGEYLQESRAQCLLVVSLVVTF